MMTLEQIRYWRCMNLAIEEQLHEGVQPTPERTLELLSQYAAKLPETNPEPILKTVNFQEF